MKYFLDTEFIENGCTIDLISIGIVCDDNRTIYLQNLDCRFERAGDWVWRNVFPHLGHFDMSGTRSCIGQPGLDTLSTARQSKCFGKHDDPCPWRTHHEIRDEIKRFCDQEEHGKPEFWGYFADYDWVAFCQLFGAMIELPKGYPMFCNDLKQLADQSILQPENDIHHALSDAMWIASQYNSLPHKK